MSNTNNRSKSKRKASVTRSFRTDPRVVDLATKRAESDGMTLNRAIGLILQGYGQGKIQLTEAVSFNTEDSQKKKN